MTASSSSRSVREVTTSTKRFKTLTPPHLPLDLVSHILCRLSVKQLLQLCCVCKSWNSLIFLDSNFARKQLSFSTFNKGRHHLIQSPSESSRRKFRLYHSPISSFFTSASIVPVKQLRHTLTRVLNNEQSRVEITTCDGILCFPINKSSAVLYNPLIRKSKILPPLKYPKKPCFQNSYTLVYDRIASNYKIIATVTLRDRKTQVNIHTLGTDYWRRIQDFPCSSLICKPGVFVKDTVNWFAYDPNSPRVIVSLDLEKESYHKLSSPSYDIGLELVMSLEALRGCLAILSRLQNFSNVWIMKEYGNEKSWTKLLSVPLIDECGLYGGYLKVLYMSVDDQLLMEFYNEGNTYTKHGLVVYDSINNTFNRPKMQNIIVELKVAPHFYVESLISPL